MKTKAVVVTALLAGMAKGGLQITFIWLVIELILHFAKGMIFNWWSLYIFAISCVVSSILKYYDLKNRKVNFSELKKTIDLTRV
jgi:hypothetical protein